MKHVLKATCISAALVAATTLLLACDPRPDPTDPRVPERTEPESVAAVEQGKPAAPVQVDYEVTGTPVVDQVTEIALEFRTAMEAPVYATYRPVDSSAISLVDAAPGRVALAMQSDGEGIAGSDRLRIIPHREGRHFINVVVDVETEDGPVTRSLSIPIEVAGLGASLRGKDAEELQRPTVETEASGEAIISMPAREREQE
jgi:hypothetical protein